ncbi:hypothetical protein [[Eubacterium] cellulosolvens]
MIDRRPCILGARGNKARNEDRECVRHGPFDVWRTREDSVLISDMGGPYEGVKDCYGLGISLVEAAKIARIHAQVSQAKIVTTERKCRKCGTRFWPRARFTDPKARSPAASYFCASCLKLTPDVELDEYWKEIGSGPGAPHVDLSEWCG